VRPAIVLGTNLVVGAAGLVWVLWRFGGPALAVLATAPSAPHLAAFAAAVVAAFVGYALRWRVLLAGLGAHPPLGVLLAYRTAGQSVSHLVPSGKLGGEPLRALLLARDGVPGASAVASVAVDRSLEMAAGAPFALMYAALLLDLGVPELRGAFVSVSLGVVALGVGLAIAARRLGAGAGVVTPLVRAMRLDRLALVQGQMGLVAEAEAGAARLVADRRRLARAFAFGVAVNALVLAEYHLLLTAFGLPAGPLALVAAIFATGAAHSLPVPAAVGALEGAQLWLFSALGYAPEVGLAVGLAVRLREVVWVLPGLVYLVARPLRRWPEVTAATATR
jgi:uncharacterized protein (TIRG00374 family)